MKDGMEIIYYHLAENLEKQSNDPYIYPMKMKNEYLEKIPPMLIISAEFDYFLTDARKFAKRLRKHKKLLDLIIIPGGTHMFESEPKLAEISNKMKSAAIDMWL